MRSLQTLLGALVMVLSLGLAPIGMTGSASAAEAAPSAGGETEKVNQCKNGPTGAVDCVVKAGELAIRIIKWLDDQPWESCRSEWGYGWQVNPSTGGAVYRYGEHRVCYYKV